MTVLIINVFRLARPACYLRLQALKDDETEDSEDAGNNELKFEVGDDENQRRRGSDNAGAAPAGGKGRGPAGLQKRRVAGPGAGGNRPGGPGGRR